MASRGGGPGGRRSQRAPARNGGAEELYFRSYSHAGIHEEMIADHVRTESYRRAITKHASAIRGKVRSAAGVAYDVVLDVGCGTGILSIFAARAGARKVYAVDASDIALQAKLVVEANGLADVINVIHSKIEEAQLDEQADILISEWMGYSLLYELYLAPVTNTERLEQFDNFWKDVYGIDMSAIIPAARRSAFEEPCIEIVTPENVLSWPAVVKEINCRTVVTEEVSPISADFHFSSMMLAPLHGFVLWFTVGFDELPSSSRNHAIGNGTLGLDQALDSSNSCHSKMPTESKHSRLFRSANTISDMIVLSTAPEEEPTHWAQTLLYMDHDVKVDQDQEICGSIHMKYNDENPRFLDIDLTYSTGGMEFKKSFVMR
eukprot:SM000007S20963  [mRNA]  locus=s7:1231302:1234668:+ [translate_table: standard]